MELNFTSNATRRLPDSNLIESHIDGVRFSQLLNWKLSPVVFYYWLALRNTTWLSFQPNTSLLFHYCFVPRHSSKILLRMLKDSLLRRCIYLRAFIGILTKILMGFLWHTFLLLMFLVLVINLVYIYLFLKRCHCKFLRTGPQRDETFKHSNLRYYSDFEKARRNYLCKDIIQGPMTCVGGYSSANPCNLSNSTRHPVLLKAK